MFVQLMWLVVPLVLAQTADHDRPLSIKTTVAGEFHNYTWEIDNHNAEPVSEFEIHARKANIATVPQGWEYEIKSGRFHAWSTSPNTDLHPGQKMELNVSLIYGQNPNPTKTRATLRTRSGRTITIPAVQAPGTGKKLGPLPVLAIFGGGLLLVILISRRRARHRADEPPQPMADSPDQPAAE